MIRIEKGRSGTTAPVNVDCRPIWASSHATIPRNQTEMTPQQLRRKISSFLAEPPITSALQRALQRNGNWDGSAAWYSSQKQHWQGWLKEYDGPGFYGRQTWRRSAEFAYNHVVCPPMVLWLGEASGVPRSKVLRAKADALKAGPSLMKQAKAIRAEIPWNEIASRLGS